MQIAFRVDSSALVGSGHLMRCLALARELTRRGARVHFVTRASAGNLNHLIRDAGYAVHELAPVVDDRHAMDHTCWKPGEIQADLSETVRILALLGPVEWLVIDNYGIDARWEKPLRRCVRRIAVIDDLANRDHDADVLVDQNLFRHMDARYEGRLPPNCQALLGPGYALLRPEFREHRERRMQQAGHDGAVRVLAFFGGGDTSDETGKFLRGWRESADSNWSVDVVLGGSNSRVCALSAFAAPLSGVRIRHQIGNMAELMAASDYAFGAAGSSNWERFCLGLDASVVCVADNQRETVETLSELGLVHYIGNAEKTDAAAYAYALAQLKSRTASMIKPSARLMEYVDGLGAPKVADTLFAVADEPCRSVQERV